MIISPLNKHVFDKSSSDTIISNQKVDSNYIHSYNVGSNIVSVTLFDDRQLQDIVKFCTHDALSVQPLVWIPFKFGQFYVVTTL